MPPLTQSFGSISNAIQQWQLLIGIQGQCKAASIKFHLAMKIVL